MTTTIWIIWLLAALVQGVFWSIGTGRLLRYRSPQQPLPPEELPPVSVVVCARNEAANLQKKLHTLLQQDYPEWELLVVDDASTDATPQILAEYQQKHPRLRVLRLTQKKQAGKKGALAAGIEAAQYDYLLLTDADCVPASPRWIQWMASRAVMTGATLVLGTGPYTGPPTWLTRWVQYETAYVAVQYLSAALWGMPYMGVGRNLWYQRQAFRAVGGFETHAHVASGDDDLLVNALATATNTAICWHPDSAVFSEAPPTLAALYHQKTRHYSSSHQYRWHHQILLGLLSWSVLFFYLGIIGLVALNPWNFPILGLLMGLRSYGQYRVYRRLFSNWNQQAVLPYWMALDALLPLYYLRFALAVLRPQQQLPWNHPSTRPAAHDND